MPGEEEIVPNSQSKNNSHQLWNRLCMGFSYLREKSATIRANLAQGFTISHSSKWSVAGVAEGVLLKTKDACHSDRLGVLAASRGFLPSARGGLSRTDGEPDFVRNSRHS